MKTFKVYKIKAQKVVNEIGKEIQFEGVEFWDKTVAICWYETIHSISFCKNMENLKKMYIHTNLDYGIRIEWSDGKIEIF